MGCLACPVLPIPKRKSNLARFAFMQTICCLPCHRGVLRSFFMDSASAYFVTIVCYNKAFLLQSDRMAGLFVDVLQHYRHERKMLVHEFVAMPNHAHILLSTTEPVEMAVKRIKGCFSTRAIKEFRFRQKIWQPGFYGRRARDAQAYSAFCTYIRDNPVLARLAPESRQWRFSSASGTFEMDSPPRWWATPRAEEVENVNLLRGI